jgi:hypothetical protein
MPDSKALIGHDLPFVSDRFRAAYSLAKGRWIQATLQDFT